MSARKVRLREVRAYERLFDQAHVAPDGAHLAAIAGETDRLVQNWVLRETMKDKLLARARVLGLPCRRDRDLCFQWLVNRAKPQGDLFVHNPTIYVQPPKAAQRAAEQGLRARSQARPSQRGGLTTQEAEKQGIGSGVARARDIIAGKRVDARQVKAFFDLHEHNYVRAKERGLRPKESPAIQSWLQRGGDPMRRAAERAIREASDD